MTKRQALRLARLRMSRTVKKQEPHDELWVQKARRSVWVFTFEIGAVIAGLVGLTITAYGLWEQLNVNRATLKEIEINAVARAWSLLTTPASGNSGKVEALQYLASQGQPLDGVDISCFAMGGMEDDACVRPPYLIGLDLSNESHDMRVHLARANFSGASLTVANLHGAFLFAADLSGAMLYDADLSKTDLRNANFTNAFVGDADFTEANLLGAKLDGANLSRAVFTDAKISEDDFSKAWAWADQPPINLSADISLCIYDETIHTTWQRPTPCTNPEQQ